MLSSYRVIDLNDDRGAMAGFVLASLGAEVIAVEPPEGSRSRRRGPFIGDTDESLAHLAYNRGKLSVTADAVDIAALAAGADVVVECGAIPVDLAALRSANPRLVTVSITPFGRGGPKDDWAATDLILVAAGGPLAMAGDHDRPPVRMAIPQSWLHAGADAACGALLALTERASSGLGQHVDISGQISIAQATQSFILADSFHATKMERFGGGVRAGDVQLPLVFPAADGHVAITFLFGTAIGPFTARLMAWICECGYCDEITRDIDWIGYGAELLGGKVSLEDWEALCRLVATFTASKTKAELMEAALERKLLIAPVSTAEDVIESDHFAARGYWDTLEIDGRTCRTPGRFAHLTATPLAPLGPAPKVGEHNGTVRVRPSGEAPAAAAPAASGRDRTKPLDGVKVLDLMWVMAGPAVTRVMADFGATVVRVESNRRIETARTIQPFWRDDVGLEVSALYQNMNAGKLGVSVDVGTPEGRAVITDLVRWADVVTESFTPGVMAAWELDYEHIREINPSVVMLSSCLMGQTGPLKSFAGFGNLAAAFCGFTGVVGWPDRPPAGPFGAYSDYVSPRLALATLLAALDHRRRTGEGQYIDFSQAEAALHFIAPALLDYEVNSRVTGRAGNDDAHMAPHGVYPAEGEDRWVAIACETDEQWRALATVIGHEELAALPSDERLARRRDLDDAIAAWSSRQSEFAAQEVLQAAGIPAHAVQNSPECRADPQLNALSHFWTTEHGEFGAVELEGPRCFLSATPASVGAAPTLGEHLFPVLQEILGYDEDRISELLVSGALE